MTETLLRTKLYIPPARPQLVPRPRLIEQLNAGLHRPLTLVAAPPGFGKTTVMSEWQATLPSDNWRMVWVSLDEQDNDPARFWLYVVAALEAIDLSLGSDIRPLLQAPQLPPLENILTTLINAITTVEQNFILVLDDYHLIETETIHDAVAFLLEHHPPQLHLALTTRTEPPLPLTRLRVRSQVTELRESDLRFSPDEIATFFNKIMGLRLSTADVSALEARTEGWVAGLQLAALSMQGHGDSHRFVQAFTGSHRYVIDYLAEEVLAQQAPEMRDFLLKTSILERLSGPLCDAVLGKLEINNDKLENLVSTPSTPPRTILPTPHSSSAISQDVLQHLEIANLFLFPLDNERRWYRYHHLFADFLRAQLSQYITLNEVAELHQRASDWFAANDYTNDAVRHALATGQAESAVTLIEKVIIGMLAGGEVNTILHWLDMLPQETIRCRPRLSLGKAWAGLIINRFSDMEEYLGYAEAELAPYQANPDPHLKEIEAMLGEAAALRAIVFDFRGDAQTAIALCRQALERLPQENQLVRSIIMMTLGNSYQVLGAFQAATEALKESVALSLARGGPVVAVTALGNLANMQREQGLMRQAAETYRQAMASVVKEAGQNKKVELPYSLTRWAYLGLAELHREWNELDEAERQLGTAFQAAEQGHYFGDLTIAHIIQAQILRAKGQLDEALATIHKTKDTLSESPVIPWLRAVEARMWLAQGNLAAARAWAAQSGLPGSDPEGYIHLPGEHTTLARVWLAEEKFEEATDLLERMAKTFKRDGRNGRLVEVLMLQALAFFAQGKRNQTLGPLTQALGLGQKGGFVRLFVDEGPVMAQLLNLNRSRIDATLQPYTEKLLVAFGEFQTDTASPAGSSRSGNRQAESLIEPLSDRELEVLQLITAGLSNQEIADQLIIAEGTVKKHIHNIFGKLGVRRRSQAILRATDLGLI